MSSSTSSNSLPFSQNLHSAITNDASSSLVYSPFSVMMSLCMLALGARGSSLQQIQNVVSCEHQDNKEQMQEMLKAATASQETLMITNAMYPVKDVTLRPQFLSDMKQYYAAEVKSLDYKQSPEESRTVINSDVSKWTNDQIQNLLPRGSITDMTRNVLVNTIYFKGKWKHPFKKENTIDSSFHLLPSSADSNPTVQVKMMQMKKRIKLQWMDYGDGTEGLLLPFEAEEFVMEFVKPSRQENSPPSMQSLKNAEAKALNESDGERKEAQFKLVQIPRFTLESFFELKKVLASMGVNDIFSPQTANLSGMFEGVLGEPGQLFVSDVFCKAKMVVNEEGAEAAAASAVVVNERSTSFREPDKQFVLDSPFFVKLRFRDQVIFASRVLNPKTM